MQHGTSKVHAAGRESAIQARLEPGLHTELLVPLVLPALLPCRAPEAVRFSPYDLVIVPRERLALHSEYFTISANGVMTIRKGVQAEFVPLAAWVRQSSLFDLVSNIGFFKNYITGRAFRRWHKVRLAGSLRIAGHAIGAITATDCAAGVACCGCCLLCSHAC